MENIGNLFGLVWEITNATNKLTEEEMMTVICMIIDTYHAEHHDSMLPAEIAQKIADTVAAVNEEEGVWEE